MLGGLAFTWWGGRSFDRSVKFWRLYADAINDVGLTLEMLSPFCGRHFLLVACTWRPHQHAFSALAGGVGGWVGGWVGGVGGWMDGSGSPALVVAPGVPPSLSLSLSSS
jgi:hypothetical protein